jgi:hypothetical protein
MVLSKDIDGLHTGHTLLRRHFIEGVDEPGVQGSPPLGSGREPKDHHDRLLRVLEGPETVVLQQPGGWLRPTVFTLAPPRHPPEVCRA